MTEEEYPKWKPEKEMCKWDSEVWDISWESGRPVTCAGLCAPPGMTWEGLDLSSLADAEALQKQEVNNKAKMESTW